MGVRIASLLPSATDVVLALGLGEQLVGVTFECSVPDELRGRVRVVVGGQDTRSMTPADIDAEVRRRAAAGEDIYTLHAGALADLDADLVLTQDLCRVCAIPSDQVDAALAHLGCTADVIALDPHRLDEVLASIIEVGARTGIPEHAADVVAALQRRLDQVSAQVAGHPRPRVAIVEWVDPPFDAGHWVPDLITAAGGTPVFGEAGRRSLTSTWAELAQCQPDIVMISPCGFNLAAASAQAEQVLDQLPPAAQVWAVDADRLVVRPGPYLVDGVEALAWVLHPGQIPEPPAGSVQRIR